MIIFFCKKANKVEVNPTTPVYYLLSEIEQRQCRRRLRKSGGANSNRFYTSASVLLSISSKCWGTLVSPGLAPFGYGPEKCIGLYIKHDA